MKSISNSKFPLDSIDEIKKGELGADCLQTINTPQLPNCARIYYESKRAKNFSPTWIEKFKADMREKGVDLGILVTTMLPKELESMGLMLNKQGRTRAIRCHFFMAILHQLSLVCR